MKAAPVCIICLMESNPTFDLGFAYVVGAAMGTRGVHLPYIKCDEHWKAYEGVKARLESIADKYEKAVIG